MDQVAHTQATTGTQGITATTVATQKDTTEVEMPFVEMITDATTTDVIMIAETIPEEIWNSAMIETAITAVMIDRITTQMLIKNIAATTISAPITKNALSKLAGKNTTSAPGTKNAPTC